MSPTAAKFPTFKIFIFFIYKMVNGKIEKMVLGNLSELFRLVPKKRLLNTKRIR
jgi:hypothetical protein